MDGVFYNEALDGVLNHPHHHLHHHHHHHNGETGGHGYGAMTRNLNLNLSLNVNLSAADAHEALALTSPDLHVLRLTSPELERLIMQSCGGSNASTPVAGGPPRVFPAPKRGADEHDAFAPEEFRCHQRMNGDPDEDVPPPPPPPVAHGTSHSFEEQLSQTWGDTAISAYPDAPPCAHLPQFACAPALKDESQKVPETPPLSPIDMEDQERIKAERKRMRNRVAASKCRKRKLERLARLEERVSRLSGENGELRGAADTLRDQVAQLRHQLLDHIKSGCKLLSQQLQTVTEF